MIKSHQFRREREPAWHRLEAILGQVDLRGTAGLGAQDLLELPLLYRVALSSLSVARSISLDHHLILYLENLSSRAYLCVYGPQAGSGLMFRDFIRRRFPEAARKLRWHILVAAVCLVVGALSGYFLVLSEPFWFNTLVPADLAAGRGPELTAIQLRVDLFRPLTRLSDAIEFAASELFQHNALIALLCFAGGLLAGVPTILLIAWQGTILGALLALYATKGLVIEFIGWVSIYGVTEMAAIVLCGAAGLRIGELVVFPGDYTRLESLALHGSTAALVVIGGLGMLVIASILEAFLRQYVISTEFRYLIAALSLACWSIYFLLSRRGDPL
jgi:uncharacterized membrane protein SpoIIM required for sporulation